MNGISAARLGAVACADASFAQDWTWCKEEKRTYYVLYSPRAVQGCGADVEEIVANRLDLAFAVVVGALPFLKSSQVKAYSVSAPARMAVIPNVQTFTELGHPALNASVYFALAASAGTSPDILARVAAESGRIVKQADFREKYAAALGFDPVAEAPAQFADS